MRRMWKNLMCGKKLDSSVTDDDTVNITITNVFGYSNKGDSAIVLSMLDALNKELGDVEIAIESWHPELDQDIYKNCRVFDRLWKGRRCEKFGNFSPYPENLLESVTKLPYLINSIQSNNGPLSESIFLSSKEEELISQLQESDVIVSVGGGFLLGSIESLVHLYSLKIATLSNTPVVIYAQSIGPFDNKLVRELAASVLQNVDYITVRDNISKENLESMGVTSPKIEVTADAAFLFEPEYTSNIKDINNDINNSGFSVGITVRNWRYPNSKNPNKKRKNYRQQLSKFVDYINSEYADHIYFFNHTEQDSAEAERIIDMSSCESDITNLRSDIPPRNLKHLIGKMDLFVGTRMHSTIFSMEMGVPTISIAYLPKSIDLMQRVNLDKYVIPIEKTNKNDLQIMLDNIIRNEQEYLQTMTKKIQRLRKLARKNVEIVNKHAQS